MIKKWNEIPEQIKRILFFFILFLIGFIFVRSQLIPPDFGEIGHYRSSVIDEIISQQPKYAGQILCSDCHDDIVEDKKNGNHKYLSCEVCHGPSFDHADDPSEFTPKIPNLREDCLKCHEYISSRPSGFLQIVSD